MSQSRTFPEPMKFCYPWRPYQARVIEELESHLADRRLHVVAAPGAGKTVLGLETVRRLDRPTLILSPTITIRNQWLDRLKHLFLPPASKPRDWISTDIHAPKLVTSITYQALHAAMSGVEGSEEEPEEEPSGVTNTDKRKKTDVVVLLKQAGVTTVVLDECHHLRSEWWKALVHTLNELDDCKVVSLTATPPCDVGVHEWQRYQDLCGPVDAEISIPELVLAANLCPHQDYVYLSRPSSAEKKRIGEFRKQVNAIVGDLTENQGLIEAIEAHRFLERPQDHVADILEQVAYFSSIVFFLRDSSGHTPAGLLEAMGMQRQRMPRMTLEWWEELLTGVLFTDRDSYADHDEVLSAIERDLKRAGAVERRRIHLRATKFTRKLLTTSLSKLDSIRDVVRIEHGSLGSDLRQVILTDFIRAADMPKSADDIEPITRIGVVPIFERIRREEFQGMKLGVLCGSLVVVPSGSLDILRQCATDLKIDKAKLSIRPLSHDQRYQQVDIRGADKKRVVRLITEVFTRGGITVLVGTKSLLGEGWDAPSINSLILASFVGSFMLSNQMRGRAIRVERGNPDKTANIWHLVCVDDERDAYGEPIPGEDWDTMVRRFKAFAGPSMVEPVIENGFDRMGIDKATISGRNIQSVNQATVALALDRNGLRAKWKEALANAEGLRMVRELAVPREITTRGYVLVDAIKAVIQQGISTGMFVITSIKVDASDSSFRTQLMILAVIFGLGALCALPFFLKALWLIVQHGSVAGSMRQIGYALLRSLRQCEVVKTPLAKMRVVTVKAGPDRVLCRLEGASTFEKAQFVDALAELFDPIDNPRYLLIRRSRLMGFITRRDYHAVPSALGRKKDYAQFFKWAWGHYVGRAQLLYTRNTEGRQALLKARGHALSAALLARAERKNRWR